MRDLLEQQLAARLRELGETVPDQVGAPPDLELRVQREHRRARRGRVWPAIAAAAVVVAFVGGLAVARGTAGRGSVRVAASPSTQLPMRDALQPGTVMLSSYGRFVVSLDANGHRNATMVTGHGEISYARAIDTHHAIWYLSRRSTSNQCGEVVRADIDGHASSIVAKALTFDVSRDGSRLALYGAGDLAHGGCAPVRSPSTGHVVIVDLTTRRSSQLALDDVTALRWSLDGSELLALRCRAGGCAVDRIEVQGPLGARLEASAAGSLGSAAGVAEQLEFGSDGLYVLRASPDGASGAPTQTIRRYDATTPGSPITLFDGADRWLLRQVVPTAAATYVVATARRPAGSTAPTAPSLGLYRLVAGRLVPVRTMSGSVVLTAVTPLPTG
jgi:hypothetical protein